MKVDSRWFAFRSNELLVRMDGVTVTVPDAEAWAELGLSAEEPLPIGELGGASCFAVGLDPQLSLPPGMAFQGLRRLWGVLDEEAWKLAGRAFQILEWDRNHRFCGRCGTATVPRPAERSRTCPTCGLQAFPRISPAVIVLIEGEGRLLLARSPHFLPGVYSTIAGFVEPGESLEETVAREIREEVGVEVRNIRYFGSQPWPFPHSLMIGFVAEHAGGEIRIDPAEIEDAHWFTPDGLPQLPGKLSIARALIDDFLARHDRGNRG